VALKCDQCGGRVETETRWLRYSAVEDGVVRYGLNFCSKECADTYALSHPRHARADPQK